MPMGGNAQVYRWYATNAQVCNLVKIAQTIDDGLCEIYSRVDGNRLIDVSGGSKADDDKLQVWNRSGTLAQKWSVSVCDDGSVLIKSADSGKYLSQSNGQLMSVKEAVEGSRWIPRVSPMGGLVLVNAVSGAVIDLTVPMPLQAPRFRCTSITLRQLRHGVLFRLRILTMATTLW